MQCQRHAVQLGRMYEQLRARETEVLVIGGGSRKGAEGLAARLKLPFPVLVDPNPERAVYQRYGLDKVWIWLQRSGTFLVDTQGIVRYIHQVTNPQASVAEDELMGEVEKLQTPK
jgi:peroxiredoxin